ncbi:MAG: Hsp20/alpha crystallin family protein [Bacteroidales bacterium]|nr:Hsp20/alpha crystallin family protein [Bacteroidales bacterium]
MFNFKLKEDNVMLPTIMSRSCRPFYMPDFLNSDFFPSSGKTKSAPSVNIREDEKSYSLDLAVPGMDKKDLKIDINDDVLTVSAESKQETAEEKDGYWKEEFNYSSFCKSFQIPENIDRDKITAGYRDGVISILLPKSGEDKKQSRQIMIS